MLCWFTYYLSIKSGFLSKCWLNYLVRTLCKTESKSGPLILKHHATQWGCYLKETWRPPPPQVIFWHFKAPPIFHPNKIEGPQRAFWPVQYSLEQKFSSFGYTKAKLFSMGLSLGWRTSRSFRVQKKSQSHAQIVFFFLGLILIFSYFRLSMGVPGNRLCTIY